MNKYKFGLTVFSNFADNLIDSSKTTPLSHIELNLSGRKLSIDSFSEPVIADMKQLSAANYITYSLHLPYKNNIADNIIAISRNGFSYLIDAINLASEIQCSFITCHVGFFFWFPVEKWQRTRSLKRFVKKINSALDLCEKTNTIIALENVCPLPDDSEHRLLGDNINDFEFIFSEIDSPYLKFCLDTGHANIGEGCNTYLDKFSDKLISVHYHDNNGISDEHLPIGDGSINWTDLTEYFNEIKFDGPFISECRNISPRLAAEKLQGYLTSSK